MGGGTCQGKIEDRDVAPVKEKREEGDSSATIKVNTPVQCKAEGEAVTVKGSRFPKKVCQGMIPRTSIVTSLCFFNISKIVEFLKMSV